ncbi:hypothetical protein [Rhodopirellula halodulae]|uniref:hypothetical protein n=1 Tax=Rhodopirellula halodulae TaxID=2894198 RepID=UPI001E5C9BC2|nr:hypothetical protein [Rhodopirellula sp. JC737]MCC9658706.1 hypothetical protein [Rhodopirellula sp. JC737]
MAAGERAANRLTMIGGVIRNESDGREYPLDVLRHLFTGQMVWQPMTPSLCNSYNFELFNYALGFGAG